VSGQVITVQDLAQEQAFAILLTEIAQHIPLEASASVTPHDDKAFAEALAAMRRTRKPISAHVGAYQGMLDELNRQIEAGEDVDVERLIMQATARNKRLATYLAACAQEQRFKFLDFKDLRALPKPESLVYNVVSAKGVTFFYGPTGEGKTFVATDLACHVAGGLDWLGQVTKHGPVVYIAAEDIDDIAQRVLAWANYHHVTDLPDLHFFPCPLNLAKDTPAFIESLEQQYPGIQPVLFIVDTMAMCSIGIDENNKGIYDAVISSIETIWRKYNCSVVAVHHSGRNGDIRGTSSIDGVAYGLVKITAVDDQIKLESIKRRRGKPFDDIYLDRHIVETGDLDEQGKPTTTLVLECSDKTRASSTYLTKLQVEMLQHVSNLGGVEVARGEVIKACQIDRTHERTFCNSASRLAQIGFISIRTEKQRTFYTLTEAGKDLLQNLELQQLCSNRTTDNRKILVAVAATTL